MAFENPIASGNKLIREALESPNFLTGVQGWQISRDGNAEFNNLDSRGVFHNTGPIYTAEMNGGFFTVFTNDIPDQAFTQILPAITLYQDSAGNQALIQNAGGELGLFVGVGLEGSVIKTNQFMYKSNDGFVVEDWTNIPLVAGWTSDSAGGRPAQYKITPTGTVRMKGRASGGLLPIGAAICTMPVGTRPPGQIRIPCSDDGGETTGIQMGSDGVTVTTVARGTSGIRFDGIEYDIV